MIKTAQDAYLAGRQAALEKLGSTQALALVGGGALANMLGKEQAASEGKKDTARLSASGVLAPLGYGVSGSLAGAFAGLGAGALRGKKIPPHVLRAISSTGLLGGVAYGLYRAYKKPGEYSES